MERGVLENEVHGAKDASSKISGGSFSMLQQTSWYWIPAIPANFPDQMLDPGLFARDRL